MDLLDSNPLFEDSLFDNNNLAATIVSAEAANQLGSVDRKILKSKSLPKSEHTAELNGNCGGSLKRRSFYATLGPTAMGVPKSPIYVANADANDVEPVKDIAIQNHSITTDLDCYFNEHYCDSQTQSTDSDGGFVSSDYSDSSRDATLAKDYCHKETTGLIELELSDFANNTIEMPLLIRNNDRNEIDYTPIDFKRNFAAIDSASKRGPPVSVTVAPPSDQQRDYFCDGDTGGDHHTIVDDVDDRSKAYFSAERVKMTGAKINGAESFAKCMIRSPDSHDSGIHVEYNTDTTCNRQQIDCDSEILLPDGWEKHTDPSGFNYYWHIESGTIQREKPQPLLSVKESLSRLNHSSSAVGARSKTCITERRISKTTVSKSRLKESDHEVLLSEQSGSKSKRISEESLIVPIRFAVRSLGWTEVDENDLKQERSSRVVNKAIVDLSTGRKDYIDNVSKWGDGKELILELDDRNLTLIEPESGVILHTQLIYQIRVWGVGRDNGRERDFAYVARDRVTRRYMCHVFRCDTPARTIANTLRDICKNIMIDRRPSSLFDIASKSQERNDSRRDSGGSASNRWSRDKHKSASTTFTTVPNQEMTRSCSDGHAFSAADSFPTPIEEPKKLIRCHFLGITQVSKATGIEILNEAVDRLLQQVKSDRWILCDVSVSPSTITINEVGNSQLAECRVRYLSFLGIGCDIKHCAFIMQSSLDNYMCYVFHVEPSAGALAKTIEAACKLRYQKVIDAHGEKKRSPVSKGWTAALRGVLDSLSTKKVHRPLSLYPR